MHSSALVAAAAAVQQGHWHVQHGSNDDDSLAHLLLVPHLLAVQRRHNVGVGDTHHEGELPVDHRLLSLAVQQDLDSHWLAVPEAVVDTSKGSKAKEHTCGMAGAASRQ